MNAVYRVGKGKFRTIVIHLQNFRDHGLIFGHVKNLKGITNEEDQHYQIKEHPIAKAMAQKR